MDLNPQAKSSGAGPSDTELMVPVSDQPGDGRQIETGKDSGHSITIPEPHFCRICVDAEEEGDQDDLIELRCNCKGHMSRMHRNCILKWYGLRMILDYRFKCELCNTVLHPATQLIVEQAVTEHENQGRDILLKALASELAPYAPHVDLESAATYHELVDLIQKKHPRQFILRQMFVDAQPGRGPSSACHRVAVFVVLGAAAIAAVLYLTLVLVFFGKNAFR